MKQFTSHSDKVAHIRRNERVAGHLLTETDKMALAKHKIMDMYNRYNHHNAPMKNRALATVDYAEVLRKGINNMNPLGMLQTFAGYGGGGSHGYGGGGYYGGVRGIRFEILPSIRFEPYKAPSASTFALPAFNNIPAFKVPSAAPGFPAFNNIPSFKVPSGPRKVPSSGSVSLPTNSSSLPINNKSSTNHLPPAINELNDIRSEKENNEWNDWLHTQNGINGMMRFPGDSKPLLYGDRDWWIDLHGGALLSRVMNQEMHNNDGGRPLHFKSQFDDQIAKGQDLYKK